MLKPPSVTTQNLIKARELIADEKSWCKGTLNKGARKCAMGALRAAEGIPVCDTFTAASADSYRFLRIAAHEAGFIEPAFLNDCSNHAAVMRMFNRAIELSLAQ